MGAKIFSSVISVSMDGVEAHGETAQTYLSEHNQAVRWASLNRQLIAYRAARYLGGDIEWVTDSPHNLIEPHSSGFLHRKGAAKADIPLVPLAGSRDALSYLMKPTGAINKSLASLSHGAGRKHDRKSMRGRFPNKKEAREQMERTSFRGRVVCSDKDLLLEEAPSAYKPIAQVLSDLESFGLAEAVASFQPLVTFKKGTAL